MAGTAIRHRASSDSETVCIFKDATLPSVQFAKALISLRVGVGPILFVFAPRVGDHYIPERPWFLNTFLSGKKSRVFHPHPPVAKKKVDEGGVPTSVMLPLGVLDGAGREGRGFRLPLGRGPQLLAAEGVAAGTATPLHLRDRQPVGSALGLPHPRKFTLAVGASHCNDVRFLLTGKMIAWDCRLLSSATPRTFIACFFAFSSVRKRLGSRRVELPA